MYYRGQHPRYGLSPKLKGCFHTEISTSFYTRLRRVYFRIVADKAVSNIYNPDLWGWDPLPFNSIVHFTIAI